MEEATAKSRKHNIQDSKSAVGVAPAALFCALIGVVAKQKNIRAEKLIPAPYRIGISGWIYPHWKKNFYPADLPARLELTYASEHLRTLEINGTFYSLQKSQSFERWHSETPEDFVFSVKGPRFISHMKKLKDCEAPLANFLASGLLALRKKLGPILWQLPPQLPYDRARLESFFKILPRTSAKAANLAAAADEHFTKKHEIYSKIGVRQKLRYAIEVRHPSFEENRKEFLSLLRDHDIAVVCADAATKWPYFDEKTSDFAYARLHGAGQLYSSRYSKSDLERWKKIAERWHGRGTGQDVFLYFDNDAKVHAPFDAMNLQKILDAKRVHRRG